MWLWSNWPKSSSSPFFGIAFAGVLPSPGATCIPHDGLELWNQGGRFGPASLFPGAMDGTNMVLNGLTLEPRQTAGKLLGSRLAVA